MASSWDVLSRILMQCYLQPYDERHRDPAVPGRALAAATKSVELDPMYAAGRAAYGWTLRWTGQHETALQELRTAIELTPNDSSVQAMNADALSLAGYHDESIEAWERAARLDPFVSPINQALRAWAHLLLDDFEGAIALTRSCLSRARHLLVCWCGRPRIPTVE